MCIDIVEIWFAHVVHTHYEHGGGGGSEAKHLLFLSSKMP